jgi:hypothetical protein
VGQRSRIAGALALGVLTACAPTSSAQIRRPAPAELTPLLENDGVHAGSTARAALVVRLPDGLHTNSNKPRDPLLIPIVLSVQPSSGITATEIVYPEPQDLRQEGADQPLAVFEREFLIGVQLAVGPDVPRRRGRAGLIALSGVRRESVLSACHSGDDVEPSCCTAIREGRGDKCRQDEGDPLWPRRTAATADRDRYPAAAIVSDLNRAGARNGRANRGFFRQRHRELHGRRRLPSVHPER